MQCRGCLAKFAVGLLRCPQCQKVSELFAVPEEVIEAEQEAEASMPKISVEGGPSSALGQPAETETPVIEPETTAAASAEPAVQDESETSDATPAVTDVVPEFDEVAADDAKAPETPAVEVAPAPAPKPARKTAAKKAAAKQESAPEG